MKNSVWVCIRGEGSQKYESRPVAFVDTNTCGMNNGKGVCNYTGKPCDAVEYAPVKRGEWKHDKQSNKPDSKMYYNGEMWQCSCCHGKKAFKSDYCPHCGAKMEEDQPS